MNRCPNCERLEIVVSKLKSAISFALELYSLGLRFPYERLKQVLSETRNLPDVGTREPAVGVGFFDEQYGGGE